MRFCAVFALLLAVAGIAGCRERSVPPPPQSSETFPPDTASDPPINDPYTILDQMVAAYKSAMSYSDRATVQIIGKMSHTDTEPAPWNCIVAFMQPNRLRLQVNEGIFVSDGEDCYAQIQSLPDQVLHFPAPTNWTLETLFQDVHLDTAMALGLPRSVLRFPPQLVLFFADNPLHTFVPRGARVEGREVQWIGQIPCDVIQISHSDGNRILWISQEDSALLRLDYQPVGLPVPEGFDSIDLIRLEMTDARFDWNFSPDTFHMLQPQDAIQVAEFSADVPGLPTPEEHRQKLKLMTDSDSYRLIDQHTESPIPPKPTSLPTTAPKTFTLTQVWTQSLAGVGTMAFLPDEPQRLLVPCEGYVVAILDLQGNILQKISPEGLGDSIIMNIQGNSLPDKRRIGILMLNSQLYLFDESFNPIATNKENIRHFQFVQHGAEELLVLAAGDTVYALDAQGTTRWEHSCDGEPNHIAPAIIDHQLRVLVSCTATEDSIISEDSIMIFSPEGLAFEPIKLLFGRHVLWFQMSGTTIYTLSETTDTGDVRFVGLDLSGKSQWSRLLPPGEYEVDPVFLPSDVPGENRWLIPIPSGEIWVFDLIGNVIDTFSLDIVPTGLLCLEVGGETLLIVADGETVSAWKLGK